MEESGKETMDRKRLLKIAAISVSVVIVAGLLGLLVYLISTSGEQSNTTTAPTTSPEPTTEGSTSSDFETTKLATTTSPDSDDGTSQTSSNDFTTEIDLTTGIDFTTESGLTDSTSSGESTTASASNTTTRKVFVNEPNSTASSGAEVDLPVIVVIQIIFWRAPNAFGLMLDWQCLLTFRVTLL